MGFQASEKIRTFVADAEGEPRELIALGAPGAVASRGSALWWGHDLWLVYAETRGLLGVRWDLVLGRFAAGRDWREQTRFQVRCAPGGRLAGLVVARAAGGFLVVYCRADFVRTDRGLWAARVPGT